MFKGFDPIEFFCSMYMDKKKRRIGFTLGLGFVLLLAGLVRLFRDLGLIPQNISVLGVSLIIVGLMFLYNALATYWR